MEIFMYRDYLKYQNFLKENQKAENGVQEENEPYLLLDKKVNHEHDKVFRR